MNSGNRHFAKYTPNGEEVVILGYRQKTNDVLVAFPSAMSQSDAQQLRQIVLSEAAQGKDYLMDVVGGSILAAAHHASGTDWQTHLIRQAATGRSSMVRKVTLKDLDFFDSSQKAFFSGYGESIEPEVEARRKSRIQSQAAALSGQPLPEPVQAAPAPVVAESSPVQDALVSALAGIAASNAAILEKLEKMDKPARKTTTRKKATTRKPAAKKAAPAPAPAPDPTPVAETTDDYSDISSE